MKRLTGFSAIVAGMLLTLAAGLLPAAPLNLTDQPLIVGQTAPPLTMLVMGRDHKMYYEAYNDASDVDGDGELDIRYKPLTIDYFGYFNSYACYSYDSGKRRFVPKSVKSTAQIAARDKTCPGGAQGDWSGDFLNYLTTARIDAMRKVLYGGYRAVDTETLTVLERTHIPQDAHAWGKAYESLDVDGYRIEDYTPLDPPAAGRRHLFANVSLSETGPPLLRVMIDAQWQIWEWISIERPVAGSQCAGADGRKNCLVRASRIEDYEVRVEVCKPGLLEPNCKGYPSGYAKPTGILHQYGETGRMYFGLLTGSYDNNTQGGILRRNVGPFIPEVNAYDGTYNVTEKGIVHTLDALRVTGFKYRGYTYKCGWASATRPINNGECVMWGNPIGEMLYESTRYFAGRKQPTAAYVAGFRSVDSSLGLPDLSDQWLDPYVVYPHCAKPFQIVISDIYPSYDSDKIPGSQFSRFTGDLPGLNVAQIGDKITAHEPDVQGEHFIGESVTANGTLWQVDSAGLPKKVESLGRIRGLAPEEPTKLGSYASASVAYWAFMNDVNAAATGRQQVQTFSVALASPLPRIQIPMGGNQTVTLIPFAKSVGGFGINPAPNAFQPTNQIVDFYVEYLKPDEGKFRINFEDVEQGADHDMDAIVEYTYRKNPDNTLTIELNSVYAAGSIDQHMGFVISGTTHDGIYLEVRDKGGRDVAYFMDTPPGVWAGQNRGSTKLGLTSSRTFSPGFTPGATLLRNPLWYAAKWGGFQDANGNGIPEGTEWDADQDGNPDNYFPVTNANDLGAQLENAFNEILTRNASSAAVTVNAGELTAGALLFRAEFNSGNWTGSLRALPAQTNGSLGSAIWNVRDTLDQLVMGTGYRDRRQVITARSDNEAGVAFRWPSGWRYGVNHWTPQSTDLTRAQTLALLDGASSGRNRLGQDVVAYLRGDRSQEQGQTGATRQFRKRDHILGDIIHSDPVYVGAPAFFYPDQWPTGAPENGGQRYSDFQDEVGARTPMLYFGANDGMLHAVIATSDSQGGQEKLAFIPEAVFDRLVNLTRSNYIHQYFVDGKLSAADAWFEEDQKWHTMLVGGLGRGGQAFFALDVTDPDGLSTRELEFNEKNADKIIRWQFDDSDDADLGYTYGKASIVRMANGHWAAVFGNGYNNTAPDDHVSTTGNAVLYIVDIQTGALIKKLDTRAGMAQDPLGESRPNGLAAPMVVDLNGDHIADVIYAGDLFGNVWKVDVSSPDERDWDFAFKQAGKPVPLFQTVSASGRPQPITTQVLVGRHPESRQGSDVLVYVGTGKFLEPDDVNVGPSEVTQSFYAIWDAGEAGVKRSALQQQKIVAETVRQGRNYRVTTQYPVDWASQKGWYIDFVDPDSNRNLGERVVYTPLMRHGRIILTTLIPSGDQCEGGGSGWVMELDAATGGSLNYSPVDTNGDQRFNNDDKIDTDNDGEGDAWAAGYQPEDGGIPTPPAVLEDPDTYNTDNPLEYKYTGTSKGAVDIIGEKNNPWSNSRFAWREVH